MDRKGNAGRSTIHLNQEQQSAVLAGFGPLLIVAGAGTGKTRTLTSRVVRFLEDGVPASQICAITFTNKAAREMRERVASRAPLRESFIGTFHSLGARILRAQGKHFGRSPQFVIFDDSDSLQLIKKIFKSLELKKSEHGPADFARHIAKIKNKEITLADLKKSGGGNENVLVEKFYRLYEERLRENNAFDFDDLIYKIVALFEERPDILARYQKKFRHIFIDEYQDLNNAQYELIRLLANRAESLTAVGDDAQMIYGWRGSNIDIFLNFPNDWPETKVVFLEENYRSTGRIIEAASAIIKNNAYQPASWKKKNLWTSNAEGASVRVVESEDEAAEAEWIAQEIGNSRKVRGEGKTTAILYRTNAQSRAIEQALIEYDISYQIYGGLKFYERREIKDIMAGIRYAANPKDEISKDRLEKTLTKSGFRNCAAGMADKIAAIKSPVEYIDLFIKSSNYMEYVKKNFTNFGERYENIGALIDFAGEFEDLPPFLEQIALLQANDDVSREEQPDAILMTIHLAKGLEFDRVYLAGVSEGLIPHARSIASPRELEEERRLLYVGMTRAREELLMSFFDLPSRFLSELPEHVFEFKSLSGVERSFDDEERYITLD